MNRFTPIAAVLAIVAGSPVSAGAADPVSPPWTYVFNSTDWTTNGWTVINADSDTPTWEPERNSKYPCFSTYQKAADDWIITPQINMKAGAIYKVSLDLNIAEGTTINASVGSEPTTESMTTAIGSFDGPVKRINTTPPRIAGYVAASDGPVYIGIHALANSAWAASSFTQENALYNFIIEEVSGVPQPVDGLEASPEIGADQSIAVNISLVAPTLNEANLTLSALTKIELYRDGQIVNTFTAPAPGAALTFKDTGLETGTYTYKAIAYNDAGAGEETSTSIWAGLYTVPFVDDFAGANTSTPRWTVYDGDGDGKTWTFYDSYVRGAGTSGIDNDNWLISPPIPMSAGIDYAAGFTVTKASASTSYDDKIKIIIGKSPTASGLNENGTVVMEPTVINESGKEHRASFTVPDDGIYYMAVVSCGTKPYSLLRITDLTVYSTGAPEAVTDVTFSKPNDGKGTTISFTTPTLNIGGASLTGLIGAKVLRDGEECATVTGLTPGGVGTCTDPADPTGIVEYSIVPFNSSGDGTAATAYIMGNPVSHKFESTGSDNGWTVIDANGDGMSWTNQGYGYLNCGDGLVKVFDDWVISPAIYMNEGQTLQVTIYMHSTSYSTAQNFEVKAGLAPTAEAMNLSVVEQTSVKSSSPLPFSGGLTATESGFYYIGVHHVMPSNGVYVYLSQIDVINGLIPDAPEAIMTTDNLDLQPVLTITAPSKTTTGLDIDALDRITVSRGDVEVKTLTDVTPGATYTVTDNTITAPGYYEWTVTAENVQGTGETAVSGFIGHYDVPFFDALDASSDLREWSSDLQWLNDDTYGLHIRKLGSSDFAGGYIETPVVALEGGVTYALSLLALDPTTAREDRSKFRCEVYAGRGHDSGTMELLGSFTAVDTDTPLTFPFTPETDGVYNFCLLILDSGNDTSGIYRYFCLSNVGILVGRDLTTTIDLTAGDIVAGTESTVSILVGNPGGLPASGSEWSVDLFEGDELLASAAGEDLAPGAETAIGIPVRISVFHDVDLPLTAVVNYDDDANPDDNTSTATAILTMPSLAAPTNLTAEPRQERKATLSWAAPASGDAEGYNIYRDGEELTSIAVTTYTDRSATLGTHSYAVTAIYTEGESVATDAVEVEVVDQLDGIGAVTANGEQVRWYDLQGRELTEPRPGSIVIKVTPEGATKTAVPAGKTIKR